MIDVKGLIGGTSAFGIISNDKEKGSLSHAYLIITPDKRFLGEYLKIFAELIICQNGHACGKCRNCKLIDSNTHPDVFFYPESDGAVVTEDVNNIISESYIKPIEAPTKIFVIKGAENMTVQAQNKLLKTLEEPPSNTCILIGATNSYQLLPTLKSRVKKLEIPAFSHERLFEALKDECPDADKLHLAVSCGDGTLGKALDLYGSEDLAAMTDLAADVLVGMKSSKDVLYYSEKILKTKADFSEFLSVMEILLRDLLLYVEGSEDFVFDSVTLSKIKSAQGFSRGAILYAIDSVGEAEKRKRSNTNQTMLVEWLLFKILEGKYKWRKS